MKLFLYEHITSGALINEPLPTSLAREGNDMLTAIVQDLIELSRIELILLRDSRLKPLESIVAEPTHQVYTVDNATSFDEAYLSAITNADMVLVIAPETEGILDEIQQQIRNSGTQLLASHTEATQLCSDKYLCHQQLRAHGISSATTVKANEWSSNKFSSVTGFIIKPLDGAGCIDTFFMRNSAVLEAWLVSHSDDLNKLIIQPYIEGLTVSLSLLADHDDSRVLAVNQQNMKLDNDKLFFLGSIVNGVTEADLAFSQASKIAANIHQAIEGLWGFIGIDLILHEDKLFVVDINPRLTTSYIGLRQSLNHNPAELLFTMMKEGLSALPKQLQRQAIEVKV